MNQNYTASTDGRESILERGHDGRSRGLIYNNSAISNDTTLDSTTVSNSIVLKIGTYFNPINSNVQTREPTELMWPIFQYDGLYKGKKVATM